METPRRVPRTTTRQRNCLEVAERQRVVRLRVQEILVGGDNITIRHSIPLPGLLAHVIFFVQTVYIPAFARVIEPELVSET